MTAVYHHSDGAAMTPSVKKKLLKSLQGLATSWLSSAVGSSLNKETNPDVKNHSGNPSDLASAHSQTKVFVSKRHPSPPNFQQKIKALTCQPIALYRDHHLYFVLKAISFLPNSVIERLNRQLNSPTKRAYPNADAKLRLIIGINQKIRQPLDLAHLTEFRRRFDAYVVALQSPAVWQPFSLIEDLLPFKIDFISQALLGSVRWEDRAINNADQGEMLIRCYHPKPKPNGFKPKRLENVAKIMNHNSADSNDQPILLYFHGGGFCVGNLDTHHELCYQICKQSGWPVISVDYRLAPEFPAPTALKDCLAAYAWVSQHAHDFGASANRIITAGDSAGGALSALVAQQLSKSQHFDYFDKSAQEQSLEDEDISTQIFRKLAGLAPPLAQLAFYPVTDSKIDYPSWTLYGKGLLLDHEDVAVFDAAYIQKSKLLRSDALISPMAGDNSKLCPSFIVTAELDILCDSAVAYADQLRDFGIAVKTRLVKGAPHGFLHLASVHRGLHRETRSIINEFTAFVRSLPKD